MKINNFENADICFIDVCITKQNTRTVAIVLIVILYSIYSCMLFDNTIPKITALTNRYKSNNILSISSNVTTLYSCIHWFRQSINLFIGTDCGTSFFFIGCHRGGSAWSSLVHNKFKLIAEDRGETCGHIIFAGRSLRDAMQLTNCTVANSGKRKCWKFLLTKTYFFGLVVCWTYSMSTFYLRLPSSWYIE